jgi:NAD-dependent deacetylase
LESQGILKSLVTQNIDNLHQDAGSVNVIEYHGNSKWLVCTVCGDRKKVDDTISRGIVPRCEKDGGLMKPDFIFFGEPIPDRAAIRANLEAQKSDVLILIGTTGEVMPASMVPKMAKNSGSIIIEINKEETVYSSTITDIFLNGKAAEICELLKEELAFVN